MGFVRHGQIERGNGRVGLGGGDDGGRLVGGEHHAVACAAEEALYFFRIRGDGKSEVGHAVDGFVVPLRADGLIRADAQHLKRGGGGECPFAQGLGQQSQGRNQHQSKLCAQCFHDPQRDVSLARAAGHDELATVGALQAKHHGGSSFELVVAWFGAGFAFGLRECGEVGGIVQRGTFKIREHKTDDTMIITSFSWILSDVVGGGDQQPVCNDFLAEGFSKKRINIGFGDVVVGRVTLGLHRPVFAILVLKHEINATVRTPAPRPFIPQPHLFDLGLPFGIVLQKPFNEVFELLAALERVGVETLV